MPQKTEQLKTIWCDKKYDAGVYGTKLLRNIIGDNDFDFPKSIFNVQECILANTRYIENAIILDFFGGSGTTVHSIIDANKKDRLNRKFILVEVAQYFYSVILPRIKKISFTDKWNKSKATDGGSGYSIFFKYYELEQYEEALANCRYEDSDLFSVPGRSPYQEYVFMKDEKMLRALDIDYENSKVKVNLSELYSGIDIPETLSNITGKWIRRIRGSEVEFEDGTKINTDDPDYKLIKPLIWWE